MILSDKEINAFQEHNKYDYNFTKHKVQMLLDSHRELAGVVSAQTKEVLKLREKLFSLLKEEN